MGIGMVAVLPENKVGSALTTLAEYGLTAWAAGKVIEGTGEVHLVGQFRKA